MFVQTWLPYPSFRESIRILNDSHLGLQRLHCLELLEALHDVEDSQLPDDYERHQMGYQSPICRMWIGYELQLCEYSLQVCDEYSMRKGKRDPIYDKILFHLEAATSDDADMGKPNWFGDIDFHQSHQANLVRLDKAYYTAYFKVNPGHSLQWPVSSHVSA